MKRIVAALLGFSAVILLIACADEREQITGQEIGEKLHRGVTGQGQIGPIDRSDDPYVNHDVPQTHP